MGIIERASPFRFLKPRTDYEAWEQANMYAEERAALVKGIIEDYINCEGLSILNLGPDNGGIPHVFSDKNNIISFDCSFLRLNKQINTEGYSRIDGSYTIFPFRDKSFDLIIIQNVFEQISHTNEMLKDLNRILKYDGIIYLCTPNKLSILNIISPPNKGLSVSYSLSSDKNFMCLFTLENLKQLFADYEFHLNTVKAVRVLFNNHNLVETGSHPSLIKLIKKSGLDKMLIKLINNKTGIINKYLIPTFYLILKKRNS